MSSSISIIPNTMQSIVPGGTICFEAIAQLSLPGIPPGCDRFQTNPDYSFSSCTVSRTGLSLPGFSLIGSDVIYKYQPFYFVGTNSGPSASFYSLGVTDTLGRGYWWNIFNQAGQWKASCIHNGVVIVPTFNVSYNENFRIRSDGNLLLWEHQTGGNWYTLASLGIPADAGQFQTFINIDSIGGALQNVVTYIGGYAGALGTNELTWLAPLGGIITQNGNKKCFSASNLGSYQICATGYGVTECVSITVEPLSFIPADKNCGDTIISEETQNFIGNGGNSAVLTVQPAIGTIINNLKWKAPKVEQSTIVEFTYKIGTTEKKCLLTIIPKLKVNEAIDGEINNLIQGECLQLTTNIQNEFVTFSSTKHNLISSNGLLCIPSTGWDNCFGAINEEVLITAGTQNEIIKINVNPIFPSPHVGGPQYDNIDIEKFDYKVVNMKMTGGGKETQRQTDFSPVIWKLKYKSLPYSLSCCGLDNGMPCYTDSCGNCNKVLKILTNKQGFPIYLQTALRLDNFVDFVYGESEPFTFIDNNNKIWRNVTIKEVPKIRNFYPQQFQEREIVLEFNPDCSSDYEGGQCESKC